MTGISILPYNRSVCRKSLPDRILSPFLILRKMLLSCISESMRISDGNAPFSRANGEAPADSGAEAFGNASISGSVLNGSSPSRAELNRNAEMFMRRFADSILSFAYTYMQNRPDAEEILQDTMIAYLMNAPVFANDAHARAWLLSTARNLCLNRLRYNHYRRHADLDETLSERLAAPSKEDHSYLLEAVKKLPENMRESIYLFYWEGYSTAQIAVLLDRRESTVRSDLFRARKRLKDILKEEYDLE